MILLLPITFYMNFLDNLSGYSLRRFLLFKISGTEEFKKPRNTNTPGTQSKLFVNDPSLLRFEKKLGSIFLSGFVIAVVKLIQFA